MNRRSFLQRGTPLPVRSRTPQSPGAPAHGIGDERRPDAPSSRIAGDLTPYAPRPEKPWDERRAAHLLRRAGMAPTWGEITAAAASTPSATLVPLLSPATLPQGPGAWVTNPPFSQVNNAERAQYYTWVRDMQEWWAQRMLTPAGALREKMVLFWHNHFVSEYPKVEITQLMFKQNQLFREYAFGDFRALTRKVTTDPAMLIYLDGATSRQGNPNENYARELLELFTLGVGSYANGTPHYTERDIVELAKALTGWTVNGLTSEFKSTRFDNGGKTIFGRTGNFGVATGTDDVIDHIFGQIDPDFDLPRAAIFLCSKLYQQFIFEVADMEIVAAMARTLIASDWRIEPVLRELLASEHFFDDNVIGAKIKSPAEFVLGSIRQFNLTPVMSRATTDTGRPEIHDPVTAMGNLSQSLLYPPNVKGWIGGRTWISSATVPLRIRYSKMWLEPVPGALAYGFNPVGFVKSFDSSADANELLDDMLTLLLPVAVGDETRQILLDELLAGGPAYEWNPDAPNAATRIRACLIRMANLGEYQLM